MNKYKLSLKLMFIAYPIVHKVRKSTRAKSWLIKIPQSNHSFAYSGLRNATTSQINNIQNALAENLGRIATSWWDNKDRELTEGTVSWDKVMGKVVWSGWEKRDGERTMVVTIWDGGWGGKVNGGSWR